MFEPREAVGSDPSPGGLHGSVERPLGPGTTSDGLPSGMGRAGRWQPRAAQGAVHFTPHPPPALQHFPLPSPPPSPRPGGSPGAPHSRNPCLKRFNSELPHTRLRAPRKAAGRVSCLPPPLTPEAQPDGEIYASLFLAGARGGPGSAAKWGKVGNASRIAPLAPPAFWRRRHRCARGRRGAARGGSIRRGAPGRRTACSLGVLGEGASEPAGLFRG